MAASPPPSLPTTASRHGSALAPSVHTRGVAVELTVRSLPVGPGPGGPPAVRSQGAGPPAGAAAHRFLSEDS